MHPPRVERGVESVSAREGDGDYADRPHVAWGRWVPLHVLAHSGGRVHFRPGKRQHVPWRRGTVLEWRVVRGCAR